MMDTLMAQWLFGGCFACIAAAFCFAWRCYSVGSAKVMRLSSELYDYKLHVAEHFASISYAAAIERRTVDALNEIKESLRRQNEKLDRLMEGRSRYRDGGEG